VSTCTLRMVITCRTFPENGATTCISIFIASSTARRSPTETVSSFHRDGNHNRRRRRVYDAAVIAVDAVGHAVNFDAVVQSLNDGYNVKSPSEGGEPMFKLSQTVDMGVDARSIDVDAVLLRAQAIRPVIERRNFRDNAVLCLRPTSLRTCGRPAHG
jgi:hypothetical protein